MALTQPVYSPNHWNSYRLSVPRSLHKCPTPGGTSVLQYTPLGGGSASEGATKSRQALEWYRATFASDVASKMRSLFSATNRYIRVRMSASTPMVLPGT